MTHTQAIHLYQPFLQTIAYNILGSIADAEDAVHDAFVKWLTIDTSRIENTKAYLVKMVTNASINKLQSSKRKEEVAVEEFAAEIVDEDNEQAVDSFDLDAQLKEAWTFLHNKLGPLERAVFVLREVFNFDYEDVQEIVGKKADNCRQIMSRAKSKLQNAEIPSFNMNVPHFAFFDSFKEACSKGQVTKFIQDCCLDIFSKK